MSVPEGQSFRKPGDSVSEHGVDEGMRWWAEAEEEGRSGPGNGPGRGYNTFIPGLQLFAVEVCGFLQFFELLRREFGLSV